MKRATINESVTSTDKSPVRTTVGANGRPHLRRVHKKSEGRDALRRMCRRTVVLARTIASALAAVDDVCRELRALMHDMGLCAMAFDVEITARELLNNAVIHGNCSDVSRSVDLRFVVGRRWVSLKVTDQGHGFDWRRAKNRPLPAAEATQNRGFVIARDVSAQLSFNRVGNSVTARWPCPVERHIGGV